METKGISDGVFASILSADRFLKMNGEEKQNGLNCGRWKRPSKQSRVLVKEKVD